ncbi:MAG TPA: efflux RND transporter periplasmic adaptor subunit, partial [Vicinamibacterales bacterium]|nr:efflux RND transporter periplasmic adaptor subunit [Vicinamibacterales bacterium]
PQLATAPVTRGSVVETVEATGQLEAVTIVQVGTQVSGTIKALYADYNSAVRTGQVIAQLDPSLFETQVEQARATLARLEADVERARVELAEAQRQARRARELDASRLISRSELEAAEAAERRAAAALKAAEAQTVQGRASLHQALVNLGHTTIRAPIDGVVISRNVDVGQTVAASMQAPTLFVIARDLEQMQVNARVDEADIGRIRPGQRVEFRVDAWPGETFTGTIRQVRLEPIVEQNVVSYLTVIDVPNPDLRLKPGMTATVAVEIARADDVLGVPTAALRFEPTAEVFAMSGQLVEQGTARGGASTSHGVWVLEAGKLRRVPVKTGISDGVLTAVLEGDLEVDARVVTSASVAKSASTPSATSSPLMPQRPRTARSGQERGR